MIDELLFYRLKYEFKKMHGKHYYRQDDKTFLVLRYHPAPGGWEPRILMWLGVAANRPAELDLLYQDAVRISEIYEAQEVPC